MTEPLPPAEVSPLRVPPAGPDARWCTLYHRDAGFRALAEAELLALGGGAPVEPGVWLSAREIAWATCGYTILGGRQLAAAPTIEALQAQVRALGLVAPRFCITSRRVPRSAKGSTEAKRRVADCIEGDVSVEDPLLRLQLVTSASGFRLLLESPADGADAWLASIHKPHNYLVALPVRIAQAMLHLTARPGDVVLDPFCGSGTIPLLAAWAGHRAYGSDISAACVERAGFNLHHFRQEARLVCVDAREATQTADCIVTNLPYGTFSHLVPEAMRAVLHNLHRLAPRATFVTSERLEEPLREAGWELLQVISVEEERFQRFIYVTRRA